MSAFPRQDIRTKLALALGGGSLLAFALAATALWLLNSMTVDQRARQVLEPYAQFVAVGAETAIAFHDGERASEIIGAFRSNRQIVSAAIVLADGTLLARYDAGTSPSASSTSGDARSAIDHKTTIQISNDLQQGARLDIVMSLDEFNSQTRVSLLLFASGILVLLAIVNLGIRLVLQRTIVNPVSTLADAVEQVRTTADYRRRVPVVGHDEVAQLARNFNGMMAAIDERDRALRHVMQFQGTILENAALGIISTSPDGHVTSMNAAAERLLGYASGDVRGCITPVQWHDPVEISSRARALSEELGTEVPPDFEVFAARPRRGLPEEREWSFIRRDGTRAAVLLSITALRGDEGEITGFVGLTYDLTEIRRAEREKDRLQSQLAQAQKMESIGQLAGGVAHDFNNMLGVILGHTELAMVDPDLKPSTSAAFREIRKAAERSANLTRQLLAFARKQPFSPRVLDLNQTVDGMLSILRRLIGEGIDLKLVRADNLWPVAMDPSQVDQIVANLCVNARDAINGTGRITIETKNVTVEPMEEAAHQGVPPGDFVMLAVSDDGRGIDSETLGRIFEPFFTTKGVGCGTGLGLSMVYGTVKQNRGFINVYSEPGRGSVFRIYLPRTTGETSQTEAPVGAAEVVQGHRTILLVEDEPAILEMTRLMLVASGYMVLFTAAPADAIRIARSHDGAIDLLVTDVVLPGMNGRDLARELEAMRPGIKHLYMSGYTADVIAHHGVIDSGVKFIQKPFSRTDLLSKIREVLEGPD